MGRYSELEARIQKIEQETAPTIGKPVELLMPDGTVHVLHTCGAMGPQSADEFGMACTDAVMGVDSPNAKLVLSVVASRGHSGKLLELVHACVNPLGGEENTSEGMK